MNSFPRRSSHNVSVEDRLKSLETMIIQLWDKNNKLEHKLKIAESDNIILKNAVLQLKNTVDSIHGHTSKMPDNHGLNGDHDRRYQMRNELNYFPNGLRIGIWGFIPRETYYLDVVWDTQYGSDIDNPVWSDPAYDVYTPELP